jgi:metal-responsive CopG/Arc/MetJ family transcriptional regulator
MLDDYKLLGKTTRIDVEIEDEVSEKLIRMEKHIKLSKSEIVNTALKRFISSHKDFLPASDPAAKLAKA